MAVQTEQPELGHTGDLGGVCGQSQGEAGSWLETGQERLVPGDGSHPPFWRGEWSGLVSPGAHRSECAT